MTDTATVTQADREAAAVIFDRRALKALHPATITMERHHAKAIRAGEGDGYDAVQAAAEARHRLASSPPQVPSDTALIERVRYAVEHPEAQGFALAKAGMTRHDFRRILAALTATQPIGTTDTESTEGERVVAAVVGSNADMLQSASAAYQLCCTSARSALARARTALNQGDR